MWPREPPLPWSNYLCLYLWVLHLHNQFILTFIIIQIITKNEKSHTQTQVEPIRVSCLAPRAPCVSDFVVGTGVSSFPARVYGKAKQIEVKN